MVRLCGPDAVMAAFGLAPPHRHLALLTSSGRSLHDGTAAGDFLAKLTETGGVAQ